MRTSLHNLDSLQQSMDFIIIRVLLNNQSTFGVKIGHQIVPPPVCIYNHRQDKILRYDNCGIHNEQYKTEFNENHRERIISKENVRYRIENIEAWNKEKLRTSTRKNLSDVSQSIDSLISNTLY